MEKEQNNKREQKGGINERPINYELPPDFGQPASGRGRYAVPPEDIERQETVNPPTYAGEPLPPLHPQRPGQQPVNQPMPPQQQPVMPQQPIPPQHQPMPPQQQPVMPQQPMPPQQQAMPRQAPVMPPQPGQPQQPAQPPQAGDGADEARFDGLTSAEVEQLRASGYGNNLKSDHSVPVKKVVLNHLITPFNMLNLALMLIVIGASIGHPEYLRNVLFMGVIVVNTLIGLVQELRARKAVERLSIITQPKVEVIRDGRRVSVTVEELVLGDIMYLETGQQISVDAETLEVSGLEVDESLITGESDAVTKEVGDQLFSGSFVVAGNCFAKTTKVGDETHAQQITMEAKTIRKTRSQIMNSLDRIVKTLMVLITIVGISMLVSKLVIAHGQDPREVLISTVAALIGMIPEGLVLLTSVAFAIGVLHLSRKNTLVHDMSSIETLARVDVLCLDKTGTITSGRMNVRALHILKDDTFEAYTVDDFEHNRQNDNRFAELYRVIGEGFIRLEDHNPTAEAVRDAFPIQQFELAADELFPFSSRRKWSGFRSGDTIYTYGAAEFLLDDETLERFEDKIAELSDQGYRVLVVTKSDKSDPENRELLALLEIEDELRDNAEQTFSYFEEQGVALKIISGDNPKTVAAIAKRAGLDIDGLPCDMSKVADDADYSALVEENQYFGRVTPFQKKRLLEALQANGHVVAMTGDGVNDVPALKRADCSVAMANGSDAARVSADLVLMDNDLSSMISAVYEGRRVINNIERVATLFLTKTVYTTLLSIFFIFVNARFPLYPIQFSLISTLTIGTPAFFLALRPNRQRVEGRFLRKVLRRAVPGGLAVMVTVMFHYFVSQMSHWNSAEQATIAAIIIAFAGMIVLGKISWPFDWYRGLLWLLMFSGLAIAFLFFEDLFLLVELPMIGYTYAVWLGFFNLPLMDWFKRITDGLYNFTQKHNWNILEKIGL